MLWDGLPLDDPHEGPPPSLMGEAKLEWDEEVPLALQ